MIIREFGDDVRTGERAEELVLSKFKTIIHPIVMRVVFNDGVMSRELQKKGIDVSITQKDEGFDVKVRDFKYYRFKDVLLETKSVRENNIPGWLFKATIVVYLWWNPLKTKFVDGYILFVENIREWLGVSQYNYPKKIAFTKRNGCAWSTENIAVPLHDLPIGCSIRINRNAFLDNKQIKLGDYFD